MALAAKGGLTGGEENGIWDADIVVLKSDRTDACSVPSFPLQGCGF